MGDTWTGFSLEFSHNHFLVEHLNENAVFIYWFPYCIHLAFSRSPTRWPADPAGNGKSFTATFYWCPLPRFPTLPSREFPHFPRGGVKAMPWSRLNARPNAICIRLSSGFPSTFQYIVPGLGSATGKSNWGNSYYFPLARRLLFHFHFPQLKCFGFNAHVPSLFGPKTWSPNMSKSHLMCVANFGQVWSVFKPCFLLLRDKRVNGSLAVGRFRSLWSQIA